MTKKKPKNEKLSKAMMGNQNSVGNKGNTDYRYYETVEEFQQDIDDYFAEEEKKENFPNILGFIAFSRFADRTSLDDYEKYPEFSFALKKLRSRCYADKFQSVAKGKMNVATFIFDAVNNHGMVNTRSDNKNTNTHKGKLSVIQAIEQADKEDGKS
ncbi:MAG: hypothetical protein GY820_39015 [Gammaproteobacteria bacterium]|nr:hypothetical protein [Gammaproteobacteria bacterium]